MIQSTADNVDFFISYNNADEDWAEWVAQTLDSNGYAVVLQKWDFRPGSNFVIGMDEAARRAKRTILILSPESLKSEFAAPEWAAAFVEDPRGSKAKLVPVRVADCNPTGMLKSIVSIDLMGLSEDAARTKLLTDLSGQRRKPVKPVAFPGSIDRSSSDLARGRTAEDIHVAEPAGWASVDEPLPVIWHGVQQSGYRLHSGTYLEMHLVPAHGLRVEVRRLESLKSELIDLGRRSGLFPMEAAVNANHTSENIAVEVLGARQAVLAGLSIHRNGQRSAWLPLPSDNIGSVFDANYMRRRVQELITLLMQVDAPAADRYGVAVAITSPMMLTFGSIDVLGNRSGATMRGGTQDVVVQAEDTISAAYLISDPDQVAEEVIARLDALMPH